MDNNMLLEFDNYVKKFDMTNEKILYKYRHSYRVYEYAKDIANSLKFNKDDINLAMKCALFHDIGRFSQIKEYDTYIDSKSIDHGLRGYEVLIKNNFINKISDSEEEKEIILFSVLNHNKFEVEETSNERKKLFANIVRDADKIDIMITQNLEITDNKGFNKKLLDDIKKHTLSKNQSVNTDIDLVLRIICFIFDINYKRSIDILFDNDFINYRLNELKDYLTNEDINNIKEEVTNYLREMKLC